MRQFQQGGGPSKIGEFASDVPKETLIEKYGLSNKSGWNIDTARRAVRKAGISETKVYPYLYRVLDDRRLYLDGAVVGRTRLDVMQYMLAGKNLGLCTNRELNGPFRHVMCTRNMANDCAVSLQSRERTYLLPLYLYSMQNAGNDGQIGLGIGNSDWLAGKNGRRPNLSLEFIADLERQLGLSFVSDGKGDLKTAFGPEDVFDYMYAVLHSPAYRTRYAEFLKTDFPRLPLTSNRNLFAALVEKGSELVALHLMESPKLAELITTFPEKGDNGVEKVRYTDADERVWINPVQYFQGVPREAWEFHIGGYQVLEKWLKDRKGRELSWDDVQHYQKVLVALKETLRLMVEIDAVIGAHGGFPLR